MDITCDRDIIDDITQNRIAIKCYVRAGITVVVID